MITFSSRFLGFWVSLGSFQESACKKIDELGEGALADKLYRDTFSKVLVELKNDCEKIELKSLVDRIDHLLIKLIAPLHFTIIDSEIQTICFALNSEGTYIQSYPKNPLFTCF